MSEKTTSNYLEKLLGAYGESAGVQNPQDSAIDSQLNSIALVIGDVIHSHGQGTMLDIGCGKGILLSRLADIKSFLNSKGWMYIGADYNDLNNILKLAVQLKLHRRCDVINLDELYSSWINNMDAPRPITVVVRNVLHELDILSTSKLLHLLSHHMGTDDILIIQDLLVFPEAERGNVCWDSECLEQLLSQLGFDPLPDIGKSRSGAQWISIRAKKKTTAELLTLEQVTEIVAVARLTQLKKWHDIQGFPSDTRSEIIAKIDFDLQLKALYVQLDDVGFLDAQQKKEQPALNPQDAFQLTLNKYDATILDRDKFKLPYINNFRDRANSQDALEAFLTSKDAVAVIKGGAFCGKTSLVSHVLSRRAHGRSIVPIDCTTTNDVWPILEQYLLAVGCQSSLNVLRREKSLTFAKLNDLFTEFVSNISFKTIVVFDHFESLLDPDGNIMNFEICDFLLSIASANQAKIIITTRKSPILNIMPELIGIDTNQPLVGRLPEGPYVQNILDDFVDRVAIGLDEYPEELLSAIDRFPYLATLAGKLISEAGVAVVQDPIILAIIKSYLYDELAKKIISHEARPALELACLLRIPTPLSLFENVVGTKATSAAIESGLLYNVPDRFRDDLLSCAMVLRTPEKALDFTENDEDENTEPIELLALIAECYENISYEAQGDPRWIREAHYFHLASGQLYDIDKFGSLYKAELLWAGVTLFRRFHNYNDALDVLRAAAEMGLVTYESRMMVASCLIRTGARISGEENYRNLINDYPSHVGIKTSLIDSLLNIKDYSTALNYMQNFGFNDNSTAWILGQYGRVYFGLHDYPKAAKYFEAQLNKEIKCSPIVYIRLAQAYFRSGDRDKAQETIVNGLVAYGDDPVINSLYYANLIKDNSKTNFEEAQKKLKELLIKHPKNGFLYQKLIKVESFLGNLPEVLKNLDRIHWKVRPAYLEIPLKITSFLAQNNFSSALKLTEQLSGDEESTDATIYTIFLSWANTEKDYNKKQEILKKALKKKISKNCCKNIPILTMYAQLVRMSGNMDCFNEILTLISNFNPKVSNDLSATDDLDSRVYEPELP